MLRGDLANELARRIADAAKEAFSLDITLQQAVIRPSTPDRGADYQSNAAFGLAKKIGISPRETATRITEHFHTGDMLDPPEVSGAGFVNLTLQDTWLAHHIEALATDKRLGTPEVPTPQRIIVDYSGPNVAKEMHVGHLRSTIIGDSLTRLLRFQGHEVVPQNHLGDWGTPFGMLIEHLSEKARETSKGETGNSTLTHSTQSNIADLNVFYQEARQKFDADPEFADRARTRVLALQSGDQKTQSLWKDLVAESERHFQEVYDLLHVDLTPENARGESFYNQYLPGIVAELEEKNLAVMSEGAICVFPDGFTNGDNTPVPLIIRKSDGGYTYDTTDLGALRFRAQKLAASQIFYVVGTPQRLHFKMVFATAQQAGWLTENMRAEHIGFGSVLGEDGKILRTRAGGSVKLMDLLREAIDRATVILAERSELNAQERQDVAHAVGIGAVKYADLCNDREKDYVFSWKRMLAMEGNTAVYLQYANARIKSVVRKSNSKVLADTSIVFAHPAERNLAIKLSRFPAAIEAATTGREPHKLCNYLYETATAFSGFYENCPVLHPENEELRASRLMLCALTSNIIEKGLDLLGIKAPARL